MTTAMIWIFLRPLGRADSVHRTQALEEHTPLQGGVAASGDLCHTRVSHKWLYHLDACAGKCSDAARQHHQRAEQTWQQAWTAFGQCRLGGSFLDPQLELRETCSTAEATRGHHACVHAVLGGLKPADAGITTEPRWLTATQSRPADLFTPAAVPGRSAARMCV